MINLKEDINKYLNLEYGKNLKEANDSEIYSSISKAILSKIIDKWKDRQHKSISEKRAYYMSAEFLIGRSINNNILNLQLQEDIKQYFDEMQVDINNFEDIEDCALGNGGLGRLAACFLESAATCKYNLNGYGIRYKYGLFKQFFDNGFQCEEKDDWTRFGDPWSIRREDEKVIVEFKGQQVYAVPYDMPIIGYGGEVINTLRLWQSEPIDDFDFAEFNKLNYDKSVQQKNDAEIISYCLYPNDDGKKGRVLRLKQEYFFTSASLQDILQKHFEVFGEDVNSLKKLVTLQLNDTHPVIAIPELIRLLMQKGYEFDDCLDVCKSVFAFTNHTIMGEALEKWSVKLMQDVIPEVYDIIKRIQKHLEKMLKEQHIQDTNEFMIIQDRVVHMARLAIYVCKYTNGVAQIHTDILKDTLFSNWYKIYPERFQNKTNGITPRRWLMLANPKLANLISSTIGDDFKQDLTQLRNLIPYAKDSKFRKEFINIKNINKQELAEYIKKHEDMDICPDSIFDIQIKRLHEYKRQLLNAFSIVYLYNGILDNSIKGFHPTTFIFGAKAAPGYYNAKAIIKYINEIAKKINNDKRINNAIKVVFVTNYNVSYAEKLVSGADVSEQISLAGMEASGTGNMKFMLNGTVTLGTLDGANVEIADEAGKENNYIFGATVEQVKAIKNSYDPISIYKNNAKLKAVVDTLIDGTFDDSGTGMFKTLYDSLLNRKDGKSDEYYILHDFMPYIHAKLNVNAKYGTDEFYTQSIMNMACAGKFSSDRTIIEYAEQIWKL